MASGTLQDGKKGVLGGCSARDFCPDTKKACNLATTKLKLKLCTAECCKTDYCNSATGVMVTKFTLSMMVIVGFIFA